MTGLKCHRRATGWTTLKVLSNFCNADVSVFGRSCLPRKQPFPEEEKTLDLDFVRPGGARLHFVHVRELALWNVENALGRDEVDEPLGPRRTKK